MKYGEQVYGIFGMCLLSWKEVETSEDVLHYSTAAEEREEVHAVCSVCVVGVPHVGSCFLMPHFSKEIGSARLMVW